MRFHSDYLGVKTCGLPFTVSQLLNKLLSIALAQTSVLILYLIVLFTSGSQIDFFVQLKKNANQTSLLHRNLKNEDIEHFPSSLVSNLTTLCIPPDQTVCHTFGMFLLKQNALLFSLKTDSLKLRLNNYCIVNYRQYTLQCKCCLLLYTVFPLKFYDICFTICILLLYTIFVLYYRVYLLIM